VADQHLISVDELRAAGALEVPPAWRKSLHVERVPTPSLFKDEDADSDGQQLTGGEPDADESADERP
jgi:hypothetical protein